jgi:hypothetical protein
MNPKRSDNRPLPFPAWMEKKYPHKTAARSFLKMIGALDIAYLMYRMGTKTETTEKPQTSHMIPAMPLKVEEYKKPQTKKAVKPRAKKPAAPKKEPELTVEFEHKPEPLKTPREPLPTIEPEPLELEAEAIMETPAAKKKNTVWLDDQSLEDIDLRKSRHELTHGSVTLSFDVQDIDDEEETQIIVNNTAWRIMLPSPSMNLSRMAQIVRISYGEIYVLGRAALGAMSGEGYVSSDEVIRIAEALAATDKKTLVLDVQYYDKDATSKKRTPHTIGIRFERV